MQVLKYRILNIEQGILNYEVKKILTKTNHLYHADYLGVKLQIELI